MPSCSAPLSFHDRVLEAAPAALARSASRVVPLDIDGRRVWLKRAGPAKIRPLHLLQRVLSALVPIRLLRYTGGISGRCALEQEVRIIERLRLRGARVPEVIVKEAGWIALGDLGLSLEKMLSRAPNRAQALQLAADGAWALIRLHRNGGWHGNPQLRNIVGRPGRIGFIDFEEDVGARLGPASAQVRDWILFLSSFYRTESRFPGILSELMRQIRPAVPAHALRVLLRFRLLGAPLALLLRPLASWLGRDVRQSILLWEACREVDPELCRRLRIVIRVGTTVGALFWILGQRAR